MVTILARPNALARFRPQKVAIDQLFWSPIFAIVFFAYLGFAEGKSFSQVRVAAVKANGMASGGCVELPSFLVAYHAYTFPSTCARK